MPDLAAALMRSGDVETEVTDWGRLVWMISGRLGNSTTMTVGRCHIQPGMANPRHYHPNCDEVLHVLQGTIAHSLDDQTVSMSAGDTISIPRGVLHNAHNTGTTEAIFVISFSSADRRVVGEA